MGLMFCIPELKSHKVLFLKTISRLLCVEPNRRMTIDEFLEHGWILNDNLPDTVLFTPKIIADDVSTKFFFHLCDSPSKELSSINKVSLV